MVDNANLWWANCCRGYYVVEPLHGGGYWNVDHRRWPHGTRRRQLGTAATAQEARALAQADYDLVRERK